MGQSKGIEHCMSCFQLVASHTASTRGPGRPRGPVILLLGAAPGVWATRFAAVKWTGKPPSPRSLIGGGWRGAGSLASGAFRGRMFPIPCDIIIRIQHFFWKMARSYFCCWISCHMKLMYLWCPSMILMQGTLESRRAWRFRLLTSNDLYCQSFGAQGNGLKPSSFSFCFYSWSWEQPPCWCWLSALLMELGLELGDLISESVAAPVSFPLGDCMLWNSCYLVASFTYISFATNT